MWRCYLHLNGIFILTFYFFWISAFITRCLLTTLTSLLFLALEKFVHCLAGTVQVFSSKRNCCFLQYSWWANNDVFYCQVCFVRSKFRSKNTDLLDVNIMYSRQAKEHISKCYFTLGSWSQLFLTLPLRSVRRSQAIYEDIYTTHNLTVPIVYHFVICIFTSITSKLFMTSKLTQ